MSDSLNKRRVDIEQKKGSELNQLIYAINDLKKVVSNELKNC